MCSGRCLSGFSCERFIRQKLMKPSLMHSRHILRFTLDFESGVQVCRDSLGFEDNLK